MGGKKQGGKGIITIKVAGQRTMSGHFCFIVILIQGRAHSGRKKILYSLEVDGS